MSNRAFFDDFQFSQNLVQPYKLNWGTEALSWKAVFQVIVLAYNTIWDVVVCCPGQVINSITFNLFPEFVINSITSTLQDFKTIVDLAIKYLKMADADKDKAVYSRLAGQLVPILINRVRKLFASKMA